MKNTALDNSDANELKYFLRSISQHLKCIVGTGREKVIDTTTDFPTILLRL